jgi:flagellar basal-body rod protein FlgG
VIDAIQISAGALRAQQQQLDVISNNLANVQTPGFKRARVAFSALSAAPVEAGAERADAEHVGHGAALHWLQMVNEQGPLRGTDRQFDLAVDGPGFFELEDSSGRIRYTRVGQFMVDADGFLATREGSRLTPEIAIPRDAERIELQASGELFAYFADRLEPESIGSLGLVNFASPERLQPADHNTYTANEAAGAASYGLPGDAGFGQLVQGALEQSNVDLAEEMSNLVLAQRAYQLNARVLQASDQILETISNLRR